MGKEGRGRGGGVGGDGSGDGGGGVLGGDRERHDEFGGTAQR